MDIIDQGHITELMQSIEAAGHRRTAPTILSVTRFRSFFMTVLASNFSYLKFKSLHSF